MDRTAERSDNPAGQRVRQRGDLVVATQIKNGGKTLRVGGRVNRLDIGPIDRTSPAVLAAGAADLAKVRQGAGAWHASIPPRSRLSSDDVAVGRPGHRSLTLWGQ